MNKIKQFFFGYETPTCFYERSPFLSVLIILDLIGYSLFGISVIF